MNLMSICQQYQIYINLHDIHNIHNNKPIYNNIQCTYDTDSES